MIEENQALSTHQARGPAWQVQEKVRLMRDGVINNIGNFVARLVGIVLVPFLVHYLGMELYGVWLAALAFTGTITIFAVGLEWSVEHAVAAASVQGEPASIDLVRAAGTLSLVAGLVGGILVGAAGGYVGPVIHLEHSIARTAELVFELTGATFMVDRLRLHYMSIVKGARRFDLANLAAVAEVLTRGVGIMVLLRAGFGLIAIAAFHLAVRSTGLIALGAIAMRTNPRYALPFGPFSLKPIRHYLGFGLTVYSAFSILEVVWQVPPLFIGIVLGPAEIVTYHVGTRFPYAAMSIGTRCGDVLFPEASRFGSTEWASGVLETGTRWLILLMLPSCALLALIAPQLLTVWLRVVPAGAVAIFRVMAVAVFVDAIAVAPQFVLFSSGETRLPFAIFSIEAIVNAGLSLLLLSRLGVTGAAWAVLVTTTLRACAMMAIAGRICKYPMVELVSTAIRGLFPALATSMLLVVTVGASVDQAKWPMLFLTVAAAAAAYVAVLQLFGAREEERLLIRSVLDSFRRIPRICFELRKRKQDPGCVSKNLI